MIKEFLTKYFCPHVWEYKLEKGDEVKLIKVSPGLILNPGFEILNDAGKPYFWKEDSQGGWEVSGEEVYKGNWAMRATQSWSWLSQEVPVKAKRWYSLGVHVKSDITLKEKGDYENTFLTIECLDENGQAIKRQWGNADTAGYQKYVHTLWR